MSETFAAETSSSSQTDGTSAADQMSESSENIESATELNCLSIFNTDEIFEGSDTAWPLLDQVAVTDKPYIIDYSDEWVTIVGERGLSCTTYPENENSFGLTYEYVEFAETDQDLVEAVAAEYSESTVTEAGFPLHHELIEGIRSAIVVGDGWLLGVDGNVTSHDDILQQFTGEIFAADPNAQLPTSFQSCSMFFAPLAQDDVTGILLPGSNFEGLNRYVESHPYREQNGLSSFYLDTSMTEIVVPYCDGIEWHSSDKPSLDLQDSVARNEECEVFETDTPDRYTSVCAEGWAVIDAPLDIAEQVLPPKFRGLDLE